MIIQTLIRWITCLSWFILGLDLLLIFFGPTQFNRANLIPMLLYTLWLVLSPWVALTWLTLAYRRYFRSWLGWGTCILVFMLGNLVVADIIPITNPQVDLFITLLTLLSLWEIGVAMGLWLWYHDQGLRLLAGTSLTAIWTIFFALRFQGNLIELLLGPLLQPNTSASLWWLNPLLCVLGWGVILGSASFLFHSIRYLTQEFTRPTS